MRTEIPQPCPWCAAPGEVIDYGEGYAAECSWLGCWASGPVRDTEGKAIREWNRIRLAPVRKRKARRER